jgi:hypothetical protein
MILKTDKPMERNTNPATGTKTWVGIEGTQIHFSNPKAKR